MYSDDRKKLNRISVEPTTHEWLVEMANRDGEGVGDYAGALLDMLSGSCKPDAPLGSDKFDDNNIQVFWSWYRFRQKERLKNRVYQAAAIYAADPDEDGAERLANMCERANMDYTEVKDRAENDPFSSLIASTRNGTKFGECMRWLPEFLTEHGGQVPVAPLRVMASQYGFTPSMLDRVKRAIQSDPDTPTIMSIRIGVAWAWKLDIELQEDEGIQHVQE